MPRSVQPDVRYWRRCMRAGVVVLMVGIVVAVGGCVPVPPGPADPAVPGMYAVGFTSRTFTRTLADGQPRHLDTYIWYPARPGQDAEVVPTLNGAPNIEPARDAAHPLLIFSHGFGSGIAPHETKLLNYFASHGFVVAAPAHNDCTANQCPSGRPLTDPSTPAQGQLRLDDVSAVLEEVVARSAGQDQILSGLVDPARVGLAGQSFGGWTTLQTLKNDDRFRAGLVLNGAIATQPAPDPTRVSKPVMLMIGELDPLVPALNQKRFYTHLPSTADRYLLDVPQAGHEFLDSCLDTLVAIPCQLALPQDQLNQIMASVGTAFFLRYVADQPYAGSLLDHGGLAYSLVRTSAGATAGALPTPAPIPFPTPGGSVPTPAGIPGTLLTANPDLGSANDGQKQYARGYDAGEYVMRTPATAVVGAPFLGRGAAAIPGLFGDAKLSVDVRLINPTKDQYVDLGCRSQSGAAEYRFAVAPSTAQFGVFRWAYGTAIGLDVGTTTAINTESQANHLELSCSGEALQATINGTVVSSIQDSSFGFGGLAIGVGHYSPSYPTATPPLSGAIQARFTNIVVTQR